MSFSPLSFPVADSLGAYLIVRVNTSGQVAACSATTDIIAGVTVDQATKSNQAVPVAVSGIAKVYCNDTISAGGLVMTNAAGQGIPFVEGTAGVYVLGVCLNDVNATGTLAEVLLRPQRLNDVP